MSSDFKHKTVQHFEWCTELPSIDQPRESPVFLLENNEWFFKLVYGKIGGYWYLILYLELKTKNTDLKNCRVNFEVGFKNEATLSLDRGAFTVCEHHRVWNIYREHLQSKLPPDYIMGNWMKLMFSFDDVALNLLNNLKQAEDKSTQKSSCVPFMLESASKDFSVLFDQGSDYDVEFTCGDKTIKAHKNVLGCRSDVFASMLQSDMVEGKTGRVNIEDMDATIFEQFLRSLYTGMLPELTVDTAIKFYEAGDKYNVASLKKHCADYLADNLSPENACDILITADQHNDSNFKKTVIEYVSEQKIPHVGENWANFCNENSKLAVEVLNFFCQSLR